MGTNGVEKKVNKGQNKQSSLKTLINYMVEIIFRKYVLNDYHQIVLMMYNEKIRECLILINESFLEKKTGCFSTE